MLYEVITDDPSAHGRRVHLTNVGPGRSQRRRSPGGEDVHAVVRSDTRLPGVSEEAPYGPAGAAGDGECEGGFLLDGHPEPARSDAHQVMYIF